MELALRRSPVPRWLLLLPLLLGLNAGAVIDWPTEEGKEVWDYVMVRKDAYMFWWLYYATNSCKNFSELPLVMWLQLQAASLLFVDNPVGTGFSYVNGSGAYAKDLAMVASDMMVLLKTFFNCHKEFQTVPFYIFSESYGGKMAAGIGLELYKAIQRGTIKCNFAGVALGDSWISPV
ncbi:SCPEP1 isoform 15, partial [Pan troglodytes]